MYIAFDLGGTYIKYALLDNSAEIITEGSFPTMAHNLEVLLEHMIEKVNQFRTNYNIKGIAVSVPGSVRDDGFVAGTSAIPCILGRNMKTLIQKQTNLPISIENDANCAGLAEVWKGSLKNVNNGAVVVSGTGIGGALLKNRMIHKGQNLHGGEFGYMILNIESDASVKSWSSIGSTGAIIRKVAREKRCALKNLSGEKIFEMSEQGDEICREAIERFYFFMALGVFNLQYAYDPELIAIGGAISARNDLVKNIQKQVDKIVFNNDDATISPELVTCHFRQRSNLIGALYHH